MEEREKKTAGRDRDSPRCFFPFVSSLSSFLPVGFFFLSFFLPFLVILSAFLSFFFLRHLDLSSARDLERGEEPDREIVRDRKTRDG